MKTTTIDGQTYEIGTRVMIADKLYQVYNVMAGVGLVGFAKVGRKGQLLKENMSLSNEQIKGFQRIGVIEAV